ncbi:hypothetical protein XH83_17055 [Bradyrhizobium sp. CCBAU 53351]|uniref:hypothetical protein n=1 Tax=Bradyrhizobium sp. CCBAU 53351 TaxID=1325114 RepID=UPI0018C1C67D|nr:hypothetical protein [Bradyrhizobium sp. CCBAU 53351]QOZ77014.1 hypothetical protein XH83_17055 [Bradyrhizobium sp. CCBAU 53351]
MLSFETAFEPTSSQYLITRDFMVTLDMVIAWANADLALIAALTRVTNANNLHQMQRAYYHMPTLDTRVRFIRALILEWNAGPFDRDAIDKCIEKLGKLASARNHWVHGDWCEDTEAKLPIIFNFRYDDMEKRRKPVRATDITNHVSAVLMRTRELQDLVKFDELIEIAG